VLVGLAGLVPMTTIGAIVSITQVYGTEADVLPATSIARTSKVYEPSDRVV
jgi:hypothetical protein